MESWVEGRESIQTWLNVTLTFLTAKSKRKGGGQREHWEEMC